MLGLLQVEGQGPNAPYVATNIVPGAFPPAPTFSQTVYVSKGGSDASGDGSEGKPFLTIQRALTSVTDASTAKRYFISVGPGEYPDPFQIKPWCAVAGACPTSSGFYGMTEVTAAADTCGLDPVAYPGAGFSVAWYAHLVFANHQTWDEIAAGNNQVQLTYFACDFNGGAFYNGPGTGGVDNVTWDNCISYGGARVKGWQFLFLIGGCQFLGGVVEVDSGPAGALESTTLLAQNCAFGSAFSPTNLNFVWAAPSPVGALAKGDLSNASVVGTVTLNGANVSYSATAEGIPPVLTRLAGAPAPVLKTDATALAYTPAVLANWSGVAPTSVANALDRLAAHSGPIP